MNTLRKILRDSFNGWKTAGIPWRETAVECNLDPDKLLPYLKGANVPRVFYSQSKEYHRRFFSELKRKHPFLKLRKNEY